MSTFFILATADAALADAWERQLPPGRSAHRLTPESFPNGTSPGFSAVVVLDATAESSLPAALAPCPTVFVGEPRSLPYEQARLAKRARAYFSYEESMTRLGEVLPLLEEVAEKQSMLDLMLEKSLRVEPPRAASRAPFGDSSDLLDFLEGAMENLDTPDRLIAEFRRASRHLLNASHTVFFLRDPDGFRADRGTSFFRGNDPLVAFFERHPTVVDGLHWEGPADPVGELAVRNHLAMWGARLLVPVHDNGRLLGLIALGVRDDGQPYNETDRGHAVFFARLLRHALAKSAQLARLNLLAEQSGLGAKYLPGTLVLGPNERAPRHVPLVVRDLVGQVSRTREMCRVTPTEGQPFRAAAGLVAETGGVWAFWEEASGEVHDTAVRERVDRRGLLRELGLTLNHELGNALVSLATLRHVAGAEPPAHLLATAKDDITKLEALNRNIGLMQVLHEASAEPVDMRELAQAVGASLHLRVEAGTAPVMLRGVAKLLDFALRSLIATVAENRPEHGTRDLALQVRATGEGEELTVLLSLKGRHLELEGILPEPVEEEVPNQGRIAVFLAKEIIRLHHGEIHSGPGMEGTEILISLRQW